ncbi:helix-turn-helix transcriptional regulator [Hamadaea tsunoensis]|uniref:helix-turn-helix transcriptional regulator n=1 Tax=Hamadaea tsunoensis TaxID=53368 RepID=UPI0004883E41|nr:LuxR family transcriptional regulator [Hamadaea tsunoensis]
MVIAPTMQIQRLRGRSSQLAAVRTLITDAGRGHGGALRVVGEIGTGKSALLTAAAAGTTEWTVARIGGLEAERRLPYAGLQRLLAPLADRLVTLPARRARVLGTALDGAGCPDADRLTLALATVDLLAAQDRPVLACLDDAHAMDESTLDTVTAAGRRLGRHPVALLLATRAGAGADGIAEVGLGPLSLEDSLSLVHDLAPHPLAPGVAARVAALAHGNPAALAEIAAALTAAQCAGGTPPPDRLPENSPLREAYIRRLDSYERDTRWLLLLAATDPELDQKILVRAAQASGVPIAALAPAERDGLIRVTATTVRLTQPLLRDLLYTEAPVVDRQSAHRVLAGVLDHHRVRRAGHLAAAAAVETQPADVADPGPDRSWLSGRPADHAVDEILDAAAGLGPVATAYALLRAGEAACFLGEHRRYEDLDRRAEVLRRPDASLPERLIREHIAGFAATFSGRHAEATVHLRQVTEWATPLADPGALTCAAAGELLRADSAAAYALARRAVDAADPATLPLALEMLAYAEFWLGRYAHAERASLDGVRAALHAGQDNYAGDHLGLLAVLAAIRGDADTCAHRLAEITVAADAGAFTRPRALARWAQAVLDVIEGRPAEAADKILSLADPALGTGHVVTQIMATPWLVEAAARADRPDLAIAALFAFDQWALGTGDPVRRALSARCHALLAPRGSEEARSGYLTALTLHQDGEGEFERARTHLLLGQELRRSRHPRDARTHLRAALDAFTQLDLPLWTERSRGELRAAGDPTPAAALPPADALTPQQRQIARLVADGATNREVATTLFLSTRTVDHHMRNIFQRLGIRSRVELARLTAR